MKTVTIKPAVRYSEAFKMQVVGELERGEGNYGQIGRKYGIKGAFTLQRWVAKYGNGTLGKIIRVQHPKEIDQVQELKNRLRSVEKLLVDANIDLALERAYVQIACEKAGIGDIQEFKKKNAGKLATKH